MISEKALKIENYLIGSKSGENSRISSVIGINQFKMLTASILFIMACDCTYHICISPFAINNKSKIC